MTDHAALKRTPIYQAHLDAGARMVPFGGWDMPVQYTGVVEEHRTVREAVGLFDVSHMGEIELRGPKALEVTNQIITNDLNRIVDGQALYTAMCQPDGGIVDDLVVYRFARDHIFICANASNLGKDFAWIRDRAAGACTVTNRSDEYAQIAVQGPRAATLVGRLTETDLSKIGTYHFATGKVAGREAIIARTGYTGEDGFELYIASKDGIAVWGALLDKGGDLGVKPIGLGARDSLRLEMKFALYGNDIDDTTNPLEAGLGWIVKLDKTDFIGKAALLAIKQKGLNRKLVGLEVLGRGVARHGYPVLSKGQKVGHVTSGTVGPSVQKAIAMAYVPTALAELGSKVDVEVREKPVEAVVVKTPFLQRKS